MRNFQEQATFYQSSLFPKNFTDKERFPELDMESETTILQNKNTKFFIASPKILLVEDDLLSQIVHMEILSNIGCKVDLAEDGYQAVAMANKKAYDIIFMDIGLPKMNGIEATKAIRNQEPKYHRSVIVALTTHSKELEKKCREAGMDAFHTKPIAPKKLTQLLTFWLPDLLVPNNLN